MKVFNPGDPKHDDPCIFNFRLRKADIKFEESFKSIPAFGYFLAILITTSPVAFEAK